MSIAKSLQHTNILKPTPLTKRINNHNEKYKLGYTTGVYDMFHIGHLNILHCAKGLCNMLVVGVTTDELCFQRKHKFPIIFELERMAIVEAKRYVDKVIPQTDMDKIRTVRELGLMWFCRFRLERHRCLELV